MTFDRDIEHALDTWFADGPLQVADRVIDGAAARIARQPQRPAWRLRNWRLPTMSTPIRAIALTGALLIALVGGSVLLFSGGGGSAPPPTPSPTDLPTPPPDLMGNLVAGDYLAHPSATDPLAARVTVPDGWSGHGWYLNKSNIIVAFLPHPRPPEDPCQSTTGSSAPSASAHGSSAGPSVPQTVDGVVAGLRAQPAYNSSAPTAVQIGGYRGQRLGLQLNDIGRCSGAFYVFAEPDGMYAQGTGNRWTVWILDVDGSPLAIVMSDFANTPAADVAEAQAIVDSTVITP